MASVEISIDSTDTHQFPRHTFFLDPPHSRQTSQLSSQNTNKQQYHSPTTTTQYQFITKDIMSLVNIINMVRVRHTHIHTQTTNYNRMSLFLSTQLTTHTHTRHVRLFHFRSFFIYDSLS